MSDDKGRQYVAAVSTRERGVMAQAGPRRCGGADRSEQRAAARRVWRVGQAFERRGMAARLEERMRERERIARELHDTLLQATQSLLLAVHALSNRIPRDDPMHQMLSDTLQRADAVMTQGRDRIHNLRLVMGAPVDLPQSLAIAWRELGGHPGLRLQVDGRPRRLEPVTGDEVLLIAREAMANALRHAKATTIDARISFGVDRLRVCIRDDGVGLRREVIETGAIAGHWGLPGMRERARRIFASLDVWSAPGAGTEIELSVPAVSAYRQADT